MWYEVIWRRDDTRKDIIMEGSAILNIVGRFRNEQYFGGRWYYGRVYDRIQCGEEWRFDGTVLSSAMLESLGIHNIGAKHTVTNEWRMWMWYERKVGKLCVIM